MHIPDGVLSIPVLSAGAAVAAAGVGVSLTRMSDRDVPRAAVLSSAFFALSLVHVPIPGMHIHLVLCGVMGVLLGWSTFLAVTVALFLQAVLFQHGGVSSLGVNVTAMSLPGIALGWLCRPLLDPYSPWQLWLGGFLTGFGSIVLAGLITAIAFIASGRELAAVGVGVFLANLPLAVVEGLLTATIIGYLARTRPGLLRPWAPSLAAAEAVHG